MLRMLDRHFRLVLDSVPDGVLVESGERIVYMNDTYARLLGYSGASQMTHASIRDIAHPEDLERLIWFGRCRKDGRPAPSRYRFRACGKDERVVAFDASISRSLCGGELLISTIVRECSVPSPAIDLRVPGTERLSPRELEILRHVLAGRRSKEIALLLNVSEKTVGTHRSRAFRKLGLRGDRDLFLLASERGLIPR